MIAGCVKTGDAFRSKQLACWKWQGVQPARLQVTGCDDHNQRQRAHLVESGTPSKKDTWEPGVGANALLYRGAMDPSTVLGIIQTCYQ